jgi:hypothetical protein
MSYTLQAKEKVEAEAAKTPRKNGVSKRTGKAKTPAAAVSDRSAITQHENLPDLLGRDMDTSIDMIIQEQTKKLESALERSFISNKQYRQTKPITMEDTFDVYDMSTLIYVDMSAQNEDMDAIMQQVDIVTGWGLENQEECMPPPLYHHQTFAELFQANHSSDKTGSRTKEALNDEKSPSSERARLAIQNEDRGMANENRLDQNNNNVSPKERRESVDRMDWVNVFLQQEETEENTNNAAGAFPIPELYQESVMDIMPLSDAPTLLNSKLYYPYFFSRPFFGNIWL